ncbi:uncharacterized protein [Hetaerina americana]|uniref:uncharacterized protein isoform X2 n=1 Tax=Hetaerina americana TaxID=62018 RepID=UPI003A7F32FE
MFISLCLKRGVYRKLPFVWPKSHRIPQALFGTTLFFSVNAVTDSFDKHKVMESMTNKSLVQNASSATATSVNQLMVLSAAILIRHHENYRAAIEGILLLMDQTLTFINSESHQEELWAEMVVARSKIDESKKAILEMQSFLDYIEKLVTAAVETAYLAGSEFSSTALCEAFNTAQQKLLSEQSKTKELEAEYHRQHQDFMRNMGKKGKVPNSEDPS